MKQLPASVVNILSSTQVITSVSSIVKELIENSLDAEATKITVKLVDFGLEYIEVEDDGCGFEVENLPMIARSHFTSKIASLSDLDSLTTYGFRGTALNSMCSVANVMIVTKAKAMPVAKKCVFDHFGNLIDEKSSPGVNGTIVHLESLFKNVPVRREFYSNKSKCKEELKNVGKLIATYGIVFPNVRFCLSHNGYQIWLKIAMPNVDACLNHVWGTPCFRNMKHAKVTDEEKNITVDMYLPLFQDNSNTNTHLSTFTIINNRPVKKMKQFDQLISESIRKWCLAHERSIPKNIAYYLSVSVPSSTVDVNLEADKSKVLLQCIDDIIVCMQKILTEVYEPVADVVDSSLPSDNSTLDKRSTNMQPIPNSLDLFGDLDLTIGDETDISLRDSRTNVPENTRAPKFVEVSRSPEKVLIQKNTNALNMNNGERGSIVPKLQKNDTIVNKGIKEYLQPASREHKENQSSVLKKDGFEADVISSVTNTAWSKGQVQDTNGGILQQVTVLRPIVAAGNERTWDPKEMSPPAKRQCVKDPTNHSAKKNVSTPKLSKHKNSSQVTFNHLKHLQSSVKQPHVQVLKPLEPQKKPKGCHSREVTVNFCLTDVLSRNRCQRIESNDILPLGQLSNGGWLCLQNRVLGCWNHFRAKELSLFHNLMKDFQIPHEKLERPLEITERLWGSSEHWNFLTSLTSKVAFPDCYEFVSDCRIVCNGFNVKKWHDSDQVLHMVIESIACNVPFYGILDLKSIVTMLLNNPTATIEQSRPVKVVNYLKSEAVRLARNISHRTNKYEILELYTELKNYEPLMHCLHSNLIFQPFYELESKKFQLRMHEDKC